MFFGEYKNIEKGEQMRQSKNFTNNTIVSAQMDNAFWQLSRTKNIKTESLTSYSTVFESKDYYLLRSYGNFVACIGKKSRVCYNAEMRFELRSEVVQEHIKLFMKKYQAKHEIVYKPYH